MQNWGYQRKQGYKKCVQSFNKYAKSVYEMLKSVPKVCKSYFAHTLAVFRHTFDQVDSKVKNWDYQCVQAFAKWVQDAEKYVQSV